MRMEIRGEHHPLMKVFSNDFIFRIPVFQRPYAWTTEHAQELLNDLLVFLGDQVGPVPELRPYFLGSIVLAKKEGLPEGQVIDGQQRLTTLTILLAVLRHFEPTLGLTEYLYQTGNKAAGTPNQYRLLLRSADEDFFRTHIQTEGGLEKLLAVSYKLTDSQQRIRENALYLKTELAALSSDQRQRLAMYIVQRCYLIVVSTADEDSAFRIFSVLNDRGLDLSHADILKAEIIGAIGGDTERESYTKKWDDAEESIGRDAFKDLFGHLRMEFRRAKLEGTVLSEFREFVVRKVSDSRRLVDDVIVAGARAFGQIRQESWDGLAGDAQRREIEELLEWLNRIEHKDWVPVAMRVLQGSGEAETVLGALRALERLAAHLHVTRVTSNARIRRYASVLDGFDHSLDPASNAGLTLANDERAAFRTSLDGELYLESKVRVYVLLRLDRAMSDAAAKYEPDKVTVEHVLPQTPRANSEWLTSFPTPADRAWTHRIGNLVLLPRKKNSEASNYDFDEKKSRYFSSKKGVNTYALTSHVLKESSWTPAVVARRQAELLDTLSNVWSL